MQISGIQAELKLRNLRLERTPKGTLAVVGSWELSPALADGIRRNRDELLRLLSTPPIHPPEGVGWHVGTDGEIHEGLALWHADVLEMNEQERRDKIEHLRREIRAREKHSHARNAS